MNEKLVVRGIFTADILRPVEVSDREKAERILTHLGIPCPRRLLRSSILSEKEARGIIKRCDGVWRGEFERLLSGGGTRFSEIVENLMVNAGKNYLLDAGYSGGTPITSWFLALIQAASSPSSTLPTVAVGDTMASHAGWAEVTAYDEATREAWSEAGVSSQLVTNIASRAEFTISATTTYVGGAVLCSNNTKGGSTGTLNSGAALGAVRALTDGEIHRIGYGLSM